MASLVFWGAALVAGLMKLNAESGHGMSRFSHSRLTTENHREGKTPAVSALESAALLTPRLSMSMWRPSLSQMISASVIALI